LDLINKIAEEHHLILNRKELSIEQMGKQIEELQEKLLSLETEAIKHQ
jgi:uncharacterized coiled-coil protein SlyX